MTVIVTLRGDLELRTRLDPLAAGGGEFVNIAHDLDTFPGARESARLRARPGGVRKLFSPAVLAAERDRQILREMADKGFQVRISAAALSQGTVFVDRRTMVLAEPGVPGVSAGSRRYTMSNADAFVNGAYALFEAAWEAAVDLEAFLASGRPLLDDAARSVLRALRSGVTDETAARQLGMSLRTYHRRVAEILAALGAGSRFQAGVRAGELGLARD